MDIYDQDLLDEPEPTEAAGDEQASYVLRRIGALDRQAAEVTALATAERARIAAWSNRRLAVVEDQRERLISLLEGFMRARHAERGTKTLKLPYGELRIRPVLASPVVTDLDAFAKWCHANDQPGLLSYPPPKPAAVAIRQAFTPVAAGTGPDAELAETAAVTEDGEVVPGLTFRVALRESFGLTVRTPEAEEDEPPPADEPDQF